MNQKPSIANLEFIVEEKMPMQFIWDNEEFETLEVSVKDATKILSLYTSLNEKRRQSFLTKLSDSQKSFCILKEMGCMEYSVRNANWIPGSISGKKMMLEEKEIKSIDLAVDNEIAKLLALIKKGEIPFIGKPNVQLVQNYMSFPGYQSFLLTFINALIHIRCDEDSKALKSNPEKLGFYAHKVARHHLWTHAYYSYQRYGANGLLIENFSHSHLPDDLQLLVCCGVALCEYLPTYDK